MTLPQRLPHAMIDPTGHRGHHQLCAIVRAAASFRRGGSRSEARHTKIRNQDRRDSIISVGRGLSAVLNARPGGADSP